MQVKRTLIKNAKIVNEGHIFEGDVLIFWFSLAHQELNRCSTIFRIFSKTIHVLQLLEVPHAKQSKNMDCVVTFLRQLQILLP